MRKGVNQIADTFRTFRSFRHVYIIIFIYLDENVGEAKRTAVFRVNSTGGLRRTLERGVV